MQPVPWEDSQIEQAELDNSFLALDRQQAQALQAGLGRLCLPCAWWWQGLLAAFLVLVVWLWGGVAYGSSALVGVLLPWVPQALLVFGVGPQIGQMSAPAWLLQLLIWEALKWVLTLVLMALVAVWMRDVSWWVLLLALIFTLKAGWGVLFVQHMLRVRALAGASLSR